MIDKIEIFDKYFPLPFEKYICFAPFSKDSKNYDYYNDVIDILLPILKKHNIPIVQIGGNGEIPFKGCYCLFGQTSINQAAFIIKNSLLFFGADSFGQHLAGHYNVLLVDLISNNYPNNVKPYFGDGNRQIILEPPRDADEKPCLALQELPKSINKIKPEDIAKAVCKLLGFDFDFPYTTVYSGEISMANMIISTCDSLVNPQQFGIPQLIMDLTLNHKEDILSQQLQVCECSIICNKPIDMNLIQSFKPRIREMVYMIEAVEFANPEFVKNVQKLGIPTRVFSTLDESAINNLKLDWMEVSIIYKKPSFDIKNIPAFKDINLNNLYFKSAKFYSGNGKLYPSKESYKQDKNINSFEEILPVIQNDSFWQELDSYRILQKTN